MLSEISQQRKTNTVQSQLYKGSEKKKYPHRYRNQIGCYQRQGVVVSEICEGGQKVQTSNCKINKSWGCNIQHGDYS